jgi:hypothetical protein
VLIEYLFKPFTDRTSLWKELLEVKRESKKKSVGPLKEDYRWPNQDYLLT